MSAHVIVGYDGSPPSREAVHWAAGEAAARSAPLRIVGCYGAHWFGSAIPSFPATGALAALSQSAEAMVEEISADVSRRDPELKVSTELSAGPAAQVLVDGAHRDDLVVVGASHHVAAAAAWLGSTPRHLVRTSPCPVVVVRSAVSRGRPDRIVVGVDGSPTSDRALSWAAAEADLHQVDLVVVHGWWYPYPMISDGSELARDLTEIDAACILEKSLERARDECGATVIGQLVTYGPVSAILSSVRDGDLLVVGSRGRGVVASGVLGSTVNSLLDQAAVPIAVVRGADDHEAAG